ncbi:U3 small nucleolar RNA-associated protein 14 homolog A [Nasonia vitripennis]|uniref:U3 small nucleolar RNA-associated protein 14 homolog A n=1 Tax=Nasonia vitripennis TaxID=7425 RepID=A0A7M7HHG1_NASVI|nr:U3 small nucleolar RNA-associated protein 14 homolog A [Nasonia vitripennis]
MSDLDYNCDSDQELSENHSKLIDAVKQFDKNQRVKKPDRSEPSLEVSEFHLVKSGITNQNAVEIVDLAKILGEKEHHTDLANQINATKIKANVIPKPTEKPTSERIKRVIGFENSKKELTRWTGIIARNRSAASVAFPLSQHSMKLESSNEYVKRFCLQSELEQKLAELEPVKSIQDDEDNFPLTLQEILESRKEAAKFRAQQSYKEAKAHRQNKIKSKKFHRIQRKERIKKALKEFDDLQKIDPHAALEKLEHLERSRVKERMTLRHKSTGQWAKSKQLRAKYDNHSRQMLIEQLSISRELTQKRKTDEDSEEDDDNRDRLTGLQINDKDNPWIKSANSQSELDEFIIGYRKYWDELSKMKNENTLSKDSNTKIVNDLCKNDKDLEELGKTNVCASDNSEKKVIIKYNGYNKSSSELHKLKERTCGKKKLHKNSKVKLGNRLIKKILKIKTFKEKSGTSSWLVSSTGTQKNNIINRIKDVDIDEIFESVNDKLQKKLGNKRSKLERMLDQESKYITKIENKKKKDISTCDIEKLSLKGQRNLKVIIDKQMEETESLESSNVNLQTNQIMKKTDFDDCKILNSKTIEIDPNKFINMKPKSLKTFIPDNVGGEDETIDNEDVIDQREIISEAFADDNVEEFRDEKREEMKKSKPNDMDLSLPGWGNWGGQDIKQSSRRKRRFIIKVSKVESRRAENKGDVVIIEEKNAKIKQHLVSELPFPFTSVQDFEASVRAPLGRNFVPEKIFNKLIQPPIKTKMGKIIEPMTENVLIKTENLMKRKKNIKNVKG